MAENKQKNSPKENKEQMVFGWDNYKWMLIGVALLVLGFVLMWGGGSNDPNVFNYDEIFAWRRIGLAPMVVLAGFGVVGYGIMHRFGGKNKNNDNE